MTGLTLLHEPPPGLFSTPAPALATRLPGPCIVFVQGAVSPPVMISVLLHGNETSGWDALCRLFRSVSKPHRSLVLFIGNVAAAAAGERTLPDQLDMNRIWKGAPGEEGALATQVLDVVAHYAPMAALDIHNNTGKNPHYTVLTDLSSHCLGLAQLFSETAVYVEEPDTVLTRALGALCPAVAVEAGPVADPQSEERALSLLQRFTTLEAVPTAPRSALKLYRSLCRLHVAEGVRFDFADAQDLQRLGTDDLILTAGMEGVNFHSVAAGTELGRTRVPLVQVLRALDAEHKDVSSEFLLDEQGVIAFKRPVIPAMYTTDRAVIRQDCLCYLMEAMR